MARLDLARDIFSTRAPPENKVLGRDQNTTIVTGTAAGPAAQAIEGLVFRFWRVGWWVGQGRNLGQVAAHS